MNINKLTYEELKELFFQAKRKWAESGKSYWKYKSLWLYSELEKMETRRSSG
jgi:hypothetical protein